MFCFFFSFFFCLCPPPPPQRMLEALFIIQFWHFHTFYHFKDLYKVIVCLLYLTRHEIPGSAVCVFSLKTITTIMNEGEFKEQQGGAWYPASPSNSYPRPGIVSRIILASSDVNSSCRVVRVGEAEVAATAAVVVIVTAVQLEVKFAIQAAAFSIPVHVWWTIIQLAYYLFEHIG